MSHATVLVLTREPPDASTIAHLMEPFSEERSVAPYKEPCFCKGNLAHRRAKEMAEAELKTNIDLLRDSYHAMPEEDRPDWREYVKPLIEAEEKYLALDPERDAPNPVCTMCGGTGIHESTYNPDSKWDWYTLGGRWDEGEKNQGLVKSIIEDPSWPIKSSFALLTPDGEWVETGTLGWWGTVSGEKDSNVWAEQFKNVLDKFKDCYYSLIDYHI